MRDFSHHRAAGLALLNEVPSLTFKEGGFLGHVVVSPDISEKQRDWLLKILDRKGLGRLVDGGGQ
jgi:hypothetical protein